MALLKPPSSQNPFKNVDFSKLPPEGTFFAVVEDIHDEFGVSRPKWNNPEEQEVVDLTWFLFRIEHEGVQYHVSTRSMRISGHENSTLYQFLKALLGKPPAYNWDYMELKGTQCLVSIVHEPRKLGGGTYASIAAVAQLPVQYKTKKVSQPDTSIKKTAPNVGIPKGTPPEEEGNDVPF